MFNNSIVPVFPLFAGTTPVPLFHASGTGHLQLRGNAIAIYVFKRQATTERWVCNTPDLATLRHRIGWLPEPGIYGWLLHDDVEIEAAIETGLHPNVSALLTTVYREFATVNRLTPRRRRTVQSFDLNGTPLATYRSMRACCRANKLGSYTTLLANLCWGGTDYGGIHYFFHES